MASSNGVPTSNISSNSMSSAFDGMTHLPGTEFGGGLCSTHTESVELAKEQYDSQSKEYKESKVRKLSFVAMLCSLRSCKDCTCVICVTVQQNDQ